MEILQMIIGAVFNWNTLLVLVALVAILGVVVITPGKRAKVIERLGKPLPAARTSGLSFKIPLVDQVVAVVNLQLQEIGENVSVKTADNAFMTLPVKVQYRASSDPAGAVRAHYELENPEQQMTSYVLNNARQTASTMEMVELYQNRDAIEKEVLDALQERFVKYGYSIENVLVDEPQPSPEVRDSFNRVIASVRDKEAAQNIADAKQIQLVGVAKAEKESKKLQGEGIAAMREAVAAGSKESMETLTAAGLSVDQAVGFLMDTNRLDTLGTAASHGNMIVMDLNKGSEDFSQMLAASHVARTRKTEGTDSSVADEDVQSPA